MGVITGHAERSKAESKHLSPPMPNVHWITVVYLGQSIKTQPLQVSVGTTRLSGLLGTDQFEKRPDARIIGLRFEYLFKGGLGF